MKINPKVIFHDDGITLVELILVIAVTSIIILAVNSFYVSFHSNWQDAEVNSQILNELNFLKSLITRDIRSAVKPNSSTLSVVVDNSDGRTMNLYKEIENSNKIINVEYSLEDDGTILRKSRKSTNDSFPYNFSGSWEKSTEIITDVTIDEVFKDNSTENLTPRLIEVNVTVNRNGRTENILFEVMSRSRSS